MQRDTIRYDTIRYDAIQNFAMVRNAIKSEAFRKKNEERQIEGKSEETVQGAQDSERDNGRKP